jgi:AraC-like DNA-binding protein
MPSEVITWSTDAVAAWQRAEYYSDALSTALAPMRMDPYGEVDSFRAEMAMADLGLLAVLRQSGSPHRCFREQRDLGRASERTYHLVLNRTSSWDVSHRSSERLEAGDAVLFDSAIRTDMRLQSSYEVVHVKLAESWIRQWVPSPGALVGRRIPAKSGWGRALTSFAAQLSPEFIVDAPLPTSVIADHIGALLAMSASEATGTAGSTSAPGEKSLFVRIEDCITQRCPESSLTAEQVATSLGISSRTLHRSIASRSTTFGALLIGSRADLAVRMLESPLFRRLSVGEIGRRAGFSDSSHFARVLRSRTGRTPSQFRSLDPARPHSPPANEGV